MKELAMIARFLLATALISIMPPAAAQTAQQITALENLADATMLDEFCPSRSVSDVMVGAIMMQNGFSATDLGMSGPYASVLIARMAKHRETLADLDETSVCTMAELAFGANGLTIPNLMVKN